MILREKTLNVMGVAAVLLIIALYSFTRFVLLSSFGKLERQYALSGMAQVKMFLLQEVDGFGTTNAKWAQQEELVGLVDGPDVEGLKRMFPAGSLHEAGVDVLLVLNESSEVVFQVCASAPDGDTAPIPADLSQQLMALLPLPGGDPAAAGKRGFLALPDGPVLVAVSRIGPAAETAGSAHRLVTGQRWNRGMFAQVAAARGFVSVGIYDAAAPHLSEPPDGVWPTFPGSPSIAARLMGTQHSAYATLEDPMGKPVLALKADMSDERISEHQIHPHFTNIQHGLQTARRLLATQDTPNREVILITDGLPTAHFEGEMLYMLYPPDPRTEQATMREGRLCQREGITINVFLVPGWSQSREDIRFAHRLAESTKGRVFFTAGTDLDRYVVWDYVQRQRTVIA